MESMTEVTFQTYADTGGKYVMKNVDELTNDRRDMDRENASGHTLEDHGTPE